MNVAFINNNNPRNFGMLKFRMPEDSKSAQIVQHLVDFELPFAKGIPVQSLGESGQEFAVSSTPKNERLLERGLAYLHSEPKFIDEKTGLPADPPKYVLPTHMEIAMWNPLNGLISYLDRIA